MIIVWISLIVVLTLVVIFIRYDRNKNKKKFILSLATIIFLILSIFFGVLLKSFSILFIIHNIFILISFLALWKYILRKKYLYIFILSPLYTISIFLFIQYVIGERGLGLWWEIKRTKNKKYRVLDYISALIFLFWFILYLTDFDFISNINNPQTSSSIYPISIDILLIILFGLQHSNGCSFVFRLKHIHIKPISLRINTLYNPIWQYRP